MKALATDPAERYQNVEAFQQDLERYARGLSQLPQRTFQAGEAIIKEGEAGDAAFVILEGQCVATRLIGGQPHELRRLNKGELFGEAAVFTDQPRSATVTAVTDTVVGVVDQEALKEEMERTSFMSLAVRTVASTFLDLDRRLAAQKQQSQVVEQALRHLVSSGSARTPWKPLLDELVRSSGASEADVSSWVLTAKGFALEGEALVLHG
jgi:CRP-like cAMP-binding protein